MAIDLIHALKFCKIARRLMEIGIILKMYANTLEPENIAFDGN